MCSILFTYAKKGQITVNKVVKGVSRNINYGSLYNWYSVTDVRGICPSGWHIPSQTEWTTLVTELGGISVAGGYLKESGLTHWSSPNTGADNSSGFTAVGGGARSLSFSLMDSRCFMWASTSFNTTLAYMKELSKDSAGIAAATLQEKWYGISVRAVKDSTSLTDGQTSTMTDYDGNAYPTICIGTQEWMARNLIVEHYSNGDIIPFETDNTAWAALTTGAMCYYSNTQSNSYAETEATIDDNTSFSVTITGQRPVNPKIEEKTFSQNSPAVFIKLPYDTYVITEDSLAGYTLDSITPSSIMLWGGNKADESTITNMQD